MFIKATIVFSAGNFREKEYVMIAVHREFTLPAVRFPSRGNINIILVSQPVVNQNTFISSIAN